MTTYNPEDAPKESCWVEAEICLVSEQRAEELQDQPDRNPYFFLELWFNPKASPDHWWVGIVGRLRPLSELVSNVRVVRWRDLS